MGYPDRANVPVILRALLTCDGGMTQLKPLQNDAALERKVKHQEDQYRISRNTNTTMQPCDTGDGHQLDGTLKSLQDGCAKCSHGHSSIVVSLITT
jgi:hypothetical protein